MDLHKVYSVFLILRWLSASRETKASELFCSVSDGLRDKPVKFVIDIVGDIFEVFCSVCAFFR